MNTPSKTTAADMAERMEEQHAQHVAAVILSQIKSGAAASVWQSWGMEKPAAVILDDAPGLIFHVCGLIHKGRVIVALDEGNDLYNIILTDDEGHEAKRIEGVFCDELAARIDAAVERPEDMTDDDYNARLKAEGDPLLNWLLSAREKGINPHVITF